MSKHPMNEQQERDLRFYQDPVSQERLQPDNHKRASVFRRLIRKLEENLLLPWLAKRPAQSVNPELFVPNGSMALLIREGRPERLLQPGRHSLDVGKAKLEARLFSSESLRGRDRDRLDVLMDMLYERALLYVDGIQMAVVKPGYQPESSSWKRSGRSWSASPVVELDKHALCPAAPRDQGGMIQMSLCKVRASQGVS